jgi:hypothetical protein
MPLHDGTGPWGLGPGSGRRRRGRCYTNVFQSGFDRKHGWLFGVLLPLGTAIVRDLLNPSGVIRRIVHVSSAPKIDNNTQKIPECRIYRSRHRFGTNYKWKEDF